MYSAGMDDSKLPARLERIEAILHDFDARLLWVEAKLGVPILQADRIIAEKVAQKQWRALEKRGPWSLTPTRVVGCRSSPRDTLERADDARARPTRGPERARRLASEGDDKLIADRGYRVANSGDANARALYLR